MNQLILMGRLLKDPEIRWTQGDKPSAIARFGIAVDRKYSKGEKQTDFFNNLVAFGKTAEVIDKYVKQGTKLLISGRLQNDNYTNKDGQMVYRDSIYVNEIWFCEKKQDSTNVQDTPQIPPSPDGFMNIPDGLEDELPFN